MHVREMMKAEWVLLILGMVRVCCIFVVDPSTQVYRYARRKWMLQECKCARKRLPTGYLMASMQTPSLAFQLAQRRIYILLHAFKTTLISHHRWPQGGVCIFFGCIKRHWLLISLHGWPPRGVDYIAMPWSVGLIRLPVDLKPKRKAFL